MNIQLRSYKKIKTTVVTRRGIDYSANPIGGWRGMGGKEYMDEREELHPTLPECNGAAWGTATPGTPVGRACEATPPPKKI